MKNFLFLASFLLYSCIAFAQIPNSGFENWTDDGTTNEPDMWGTNNRTFINVAFSNYPFVVQDTASANKHSGISSISINTVDVFGSVVPGAAVSNGTISLDPNFSPQNPIPPIIVGGFSYSLTPDTLVFYAKYTDGDPTAVTPDTAKVGVVFTKKNGNSRDTICSATISLTSDLNMKRIAVPITWTTTAVPDTAVILMASSSNEVSTHVGSVLNVDDMMFTKTFSLATLPSVSPTTTAVGSNFTSSSAISGGEVISDGFSETTYGVAYSAINNPPTINDSLTVEGVGTGTFTSAMNGLNSGTVYYVRAYAKNAKGPVYGGVETFTTLAVPKKPTLTTSSITNITGAFAVSGGNITSDGGAAVTQSGVVWGLSTSPKLPSSNITTDNAVSGTYKSYINNLSSNTPYFVRAYAINSVDTAYGNEVSFTTKQLITGTPNLDFESWVKDATNRDSASYWTSNTTFQFVSKASAVADHNGGSFGMALTTYSINGFGVIPGVSVYGIGNNAQISRTGKIKGGMPYSVRNDSIVCYGKFTHGNNTDSGAVVVLFTKWNTTLNITDTIGQVGITEFTSTMKRYAAPIEWLSNQTPDTVIFLLASSKDINSAAGGSKLFVDDISLKNSIPPQKATVSLTSVSNIKFSSADLSGYVSSNGGLAITERGFYVDTLPIGATPNNNSIKLVAPLSNKVATFSVTATSLTPSKLYYVVAYAINSMDTSYSTFSQFYTKGPLVVSTTSISIYNSTKAKANGKITSTQNEAVIASGFIWSTVNSPANLLVTSNDKTNGGSVTSTFSGFITNLIPENTYYVRAYGITSIDTAYGGILSYTAPSSFTCTPDPSVRLSTPGIFPKTPTPIDTISFEVNQTFTYSLPFRYRNSDGNIVEVDSSRLDEIVDLPQGLSIQCGRVSKTPNPNGIGPNCIFYPDEIGCFVVTGTLPAINGQSYPMSFKLTDWGIVYLPGGAGPQFLNTTNPGYVTGSVVLTFEDEEPLDIAVIDQNRFDIVQSYPNPFSDNFAIKFTNPQGGDVLFTVVDMFGREVHRETVKAHVGLNKLTYSSDGISSGAYYFTLTNGNQKVVKLGVAVK
jgi:hypothetical protein